MRKTRKRTSKARKTHKRDKKKRIFTRKQYMSGDGMLTTVWGPSMWHYLHTMSFNYPVCPTKEDKENYKNFILNLTNVLPCKYCRQNLKSNLKAHPLKPCHMKNRETFSRFVYKLHETVNKMLGKNSGLSYCDVRGISYVSWKNNHELGDALDGKKDLDIFVPYKYKNRFYKCASKSFWIKLRNHVADFPDVSHFYKFTSENKTFHIHVYFKLITGESWIKEFDLPLEDFFLMNMERCKTYKIWKLNNDAQSYIFFIRHFLKNGSFFSRALR
mgnify:CR=1 FL=1